MGAYRTVYPIPPHIACRPNEVGERDWGTCGTLEKHAMFEHWRSTQCKTGITDNGMTGSQRKRKDRKGKRQKRDSRGSNVGDDEDEGATREKCLVRASQACMRNTQDPRNEAAQQPRKEGKPGNRRTRRGKLPERNEPWADQRGPGPHAKLHVHQHTITACVTEQSRRSCRGTGDAGGGDERRWLWGMYGRRVKGGVAVEEVGAM